MTKNISGIEKGFDEITRSSSDGDESLDGLRSSRSSSFVSVTESFNMSDSVSISEMSDLENNNILHDHLLDYLGDLPIEKLSRKERESLGRLLDPRKPFRGDFLDLAGRLFPDISNDRMYFIEKRKNPTVYLLECYVKEKKSQATIANLLSILMSMRRLDVVKKLLVIAEGHIGKNNKKKGFLTRLKRKLFQYDDTVSICSVQSLASSIASFDTLHSFPSNTSLNSYASYANTEFPLKEALSSEAFEKENNNNVHAKSVLRGSKGLNADNNNETCHVFLVSASDEAENLVRLVKWLRLKGVYARSVNTDKLEYESNPSKFLKEQLESAEFVLIFCSAHLKALLDGKCDQGEGRFIHYVFDYMNREWFTDRNCISKYVPLQGSRTSRGCIPMPLTASMASSFDTKEGRKDLLMRLFRQEKFKLPVVGSRPILKQRIITGELFDLRK